MNNTKDTNQASEDELDNILQIFDGGIVAKGSERGGYPSYFTEPYPLWIAERKEIARQKIQSIIRTEKLKLLAEVRERVVGEYETEYSNLDGDAGYWEKHGRNGMREKQIDALAKMETEL